MEYKQKLIKILKPVVKFAYLFGSVNTSYFTDKSDLDVALWLKKFPIAANDFIQLKYILEKSIDFEHEIDIVIMNDANPIITYQIFSKGDLIINNDKIFLQKIINYKTSLYFDFKLWRKNLEHNIKSNIL